MKKSLLFLLVAMLVSFNASAQSIEVDSRSIDLDVEINKRINFNNASRTATCGADTVLYPLAKATAVRLLNLNNATSASGLAQYYDVPLGSVVSISGAEFYGFVNSAANDMLNIQVSVYSANADSTPNAILATTSILTDTVFGGGSLAALLKSATFPAPVVVTAPYLVVIENNSPINFATVTNNWASADGGGEWLGFGLIGTSWISGNTGLVLGPDPFDADALFYPIVTYDITSSFLSALDCFPQGQEVAFTNTSTPIISSRYYNQTAFSGSAIDSSYLWTWGDGTETYGSEPPHTYNDGATSYTVELFTGVFGWSAGCIDSAEMTFSSGNAPAASFTTTQTNETVNFIDSSPEGESWLWDFGDGNTSTDQNPTHNYAASGNYTVCLTVTNCGLMDSTCMEVVDVWFTNINDDLLDQNLSVYPNPSTDVFNLALPLDKTEEVSVSVMNIVGQKVLDYNLGRVNTLDRQINLSGNNKGIYLLQVKVGEHSVVRRITLN